VLACRPSTGVAGPVSPTTPVASPQITVPDAAAVMPAARVDTSQCRSSHATALHLLPDRAHIVGGADIDALIHSPAYAPFLANDAPGELKHLLAAATSCGIGRAAWRSVTFAITNSGESGGALRAEGAGSLENLTCIQTEIKRRTGTEPFTIATTPTGTELQFPDESRGWVLDPCTVLLVSKQWVTGTRDRMAGRGVALGEGRLASPIARADATKHAWLAAALDASGSAPSLAGARDVAVTLQWTDRVTASASMAFADPSAAAKASAELERQFQSMAPMVVSMGLPSTFAGKVKIGPAGSFVMLAADADEIELTAIAKMMKSM